MNTSIPSESATTPVVGNIRASIFTQEQEGELRRIKAYFPYRIVWGGIDGKTHEFSAHADTSRRNLNAFLRANAGNIAATIG